MYEVAGRTVERVHSQEAGLSVHGRDGIEQRNTRRVFFIDHLWGADASWALDRPPHTE